MTGEVSKFWRDIQLAYDQVATNHEREVSIDSEADGLHANVRYVENFDEIVITVGRLTEDQNAVSEVTLKVVN